MLTIGVVSDLHFGPRTTYAGKLRKLSDLAPALLEQFAAAMRAAGPDLVVNLGDVIEDESPELDLTRYRQAVGMLQGLPGELVHVAGNHDLWGIRPADLRAAWGLGPDGPLYRSFDVGDYHVVVLHTNERKDVDVRIDAPQLAWLAADLASSPRPSVVLMHHSAADQELDGNRWFEGAPHRCLVEERRELRAILRAHGRTVLVLNGHVHWNHLFVEQGVPYVTLQSLTENVDEDAPGRPAAAWALIRVTREAVQVRVAGATPANYELRR